MKKRFLLLALSAGLASGAYAAEVNSGVKSDSKTTEVNSGVKDDSKAAECKRNADSDEAKAKEAESKGNNDLAAAYRKCAAAKTKMSEAYASGDKDALTKANNDYINAKNEVDKVQKGGKKDKAAPKEKMTNKKIPK